MASTTFPAPELEVELQAPTLRVTLADVIPAFLATDGVCLDLNTIFSLRLVSKQVQAAANRFIHKIQTTPAAFEDLSRGLASNIKEVIFGAGTVVECVTKLHVAQLCKEIKLPELESLEITQTCPGSFRALAQSCGWPKLKHLKLLINGSDIFYTSNLNQTEMEGFKNTNWPLESLSIIVDQRQPGNVISAATQWMLPCFPGLKKLEISLEEVADAKTLANAGLNNLEVLSVAGVLYDAPGRILGELCHANFPNLNTFELKYRYPNFIKVEELAPAPWLKNLKKVAVVRARGRRDVVGDGIPSNAAGALVQALHGSEQLECLQLDLDWRSLSAFDSISLPVLKSLELMLIGEGFGIQNSLDNPLQSLLKAHMPNLTELSITFDGCASFNWNTPPSSSAAFPSLRTLKLHGGRGLLEKVKISRAVLDFISCELVSKGLHSLSLNDKFHCFEALPVGYGDRFIGNWIGLLLESVSEADGCNLRALTISIGASALRNFPQHLNNMKCLETLELSTFGDSGIGLHLPFENKFVLLIGNLNTDNAPKFCIHLKASAAKPFLSVSKHFQVTTIERTSDANLHPYQVQRKNKLLGKLSLRYPNAQVKNL